MNQTVKVVNKLNKWAGIWECRNGNIVIVMYVGVGLYEWIGVDIKGESIDYDNNGHAMGISPEWDLMVRLREGGDKFGVLKKQFAEVLEKVAKGEGKIKR